MSPFSVTVQHVPDRELGPLLSRLAEAGFDNPIIDHVVADGASGKSAAPARASWSRSRDESKRGGRYPSDGKGGVCSRLGWAVYEEQRQQRPLLAATEDDRAVLVEDLQRSEDAEVHSSGNTIRGAHVRAAAGPRQARRYLALPVRGRRGDHALCRVSARA